MRLHYFTADIVIYSTIRKTEREGTYQAYITPVKRKYYIIIKRKTRTVGRSPRQIFPVCPLL